MKRVLVTGASGFIGRHTLPLLVQRGYEVHAVSSQPRTGPGTDVTWHHCGLLGADGIPALMQRVSPTHLLHLAWFAVPGQFWTSTENLRWVSASLDIVREFAAVGGQRLVTAGTCAEYEVTHEDCKERVTPLRPSTLYGTCKHALHQIVEKFADGRFSCAWGRVFHLFGPHEYPERLVPSVIRSLLAGQPALCTPGTQVRDFLHVADVAGGFVALLDSPITGPVNIASGVPVSIADVVQSIGRQMSAESLIRLGARALPTHEQPRLTADASRLRDEVGWTPQMNLESGLLHTIDWWRSSPESK
jgi:nucleoside-diphosphate-sugar epimerase